MLLLQPVALEASPTQSMVIITNYELVETLLWVFFVRSGEQNPCPCCGGRLKVIGSRKLTAKVDDVRGVKANCSYYWTDDFKDPRVIGQNVPVKYNPWDYSEIYAYVDGVWVKAYSQYRSKLVVIPLKKLSY